MDWFMLLDRKGRMQSKWKIFIKCMAASLIVGAVSGFLAQNGIEKLILCLLIGLAAYLVRTSKAKEQHIAEAVTIYNLLLFVYVLWIIFFFVFEWQIFAFAWLIALWLLVVVAAILFYSARKPAGVLMLLFLLWATYTGYLNLMACLVQIRLLP
ncbi:MAG: tryptophan-rich sensory protein [Lachnospiraceae bacterium]|nr:tryptophan-rich sensory protein [Lachnospiraceae bacterium]MDE6128381.1 tryptophan-rich sensory protein [Lachnospiraceae bacterium]